MLESRSATATVAPNLPSNFLCLVNLHILALDHGTKRFGVVVNERIYFAPSQFEAGFISTAHSEADRAKTVEAAAKVLRQTAR